MTDVQYIADDEVLDARIRRIAREEIASLAGLVLRRTQDSEHALEDFNSGAGPATRVLAEIFGEALHDFSTETEPGDDEPDEPTRPSYGDDNAEPGS
jgi:hypothetical protein